MPATDEEALEYLPDREEIRGIYLCRRGVGESIVDALTHTFELFLEVKGEIPHEDTTTPH